MDEKDFCDMTSVWNTNIFGEELDWVCEPRHVEVSYRNLMYFQQGLAKGRPFTTYQTPVGKLYVWRKVRYHFLTWSGRSGTLFAAQDGDRTLFYIDNGLPPSRPSIV
jgi:hypothetical protein